MSNTCSNDDSWLNAHIASLPRIDDEDHTCAPRAVPRHRPDPASFGCVACWRETVARRVVGPPRDPSPWVRWTPDVVVRAYAVPGRDDLVDDVEVRRLLCAAYGAADGLWLTCPSCGSEVATTGGAWLDPDETYCSRGCSTVDIARAAGVIEALAVLTDEPWPVHEDDEYDVRHGAYTLTNDRFLRTTP